MHDKDKFDELKMRLDGGVATKIPIYTPQLLDYVYDHRHEAHEFLPEVRRRSAAFELNYIQTAPDQASLLYFLAKLSGAKRVLEIGCYLGHSAIAMASALPEGGRLLTFDHNELWSEAARQHFKEAGLAEKIELRIGEALALADELRAEGTQAFDMIFIDADKINSLNYFRATSGLLRPGGLMVLDNVLWRGHIIDPQDQSSRAVAIRALNDEVRDHPDFEMMILTISDGMLIARKKG